MASFIKGFENPIVLLHNGDNLLSYIPNHFDIIHITRGHYNFYKGGNDGFCTLSCPIEYGMKHMLKMIQERYYKHIDYEYEYNYIKN